MHRPAVSAHSGGVARHRRAEYADFAAAASSGAEYVELDVRRTGDRRLVCHHDAALRNGRRLSALTYRELCAGAGYEVPTVPAVLDLLGGKALAHLDLKESGYEQDVLRLSVAALGADGFILTSLEEASIAYATQHFPAVRTALSLGRGLSSAPGHRLPGMVARDLLPLRRIRRCGAGWVAVNKVLARRGVLRQCARHGIGAMVWTVDEDLLIDRFLRDPRVDVIITNRPADVVARRDGDVVPPG
jgi:glycerophosphoryl diester phosphodiesterase